MSNKLTTREFIEIAKKTHGNFYDYSKTVYDGMNKKITVIDPEYGEFYPTPDNHIRKKSGHPKRYQNKKSLTRESFIDRANKKHNNFYDYSKVDYKGLKEKIIIIDPEYGCFEQRASNHLSGQGHPSRANDNLKLTKEMFINKSIKVHGNLYNYDKVEYVNCYTKVLITDHEFGDFYITPSYHMSGGGNPKRLNHDQEIDHIIPLSFICRSSERSKFKDNKFFQILDSDINKK